MLCGRPWVIGEVEETIKDSFDDQQGIDFYVPVDTRLRDASRAGLTPSQFDSGSRAVLAYRALLKHLLSLQTSPEAA